jgi:hypothetical protein
MHIYLNQELENINIDESLLKGMSWKGEQFQDFVLDSVVVSWVKR